MEVGTARLLVRSVRPRRSYRTDSMFRDQAIHDALSLHGYCVTDHFLSAETLAVVREVVDRLPAIDELDEQGGLHSLRGGGPSDISLDDRERIESRVLPELLDLAEEGAARVILSALLVKPASANSEVLAHQDFFLTDESRSYGLNAWACTTDADERTGALHVLPGSHKFGNWFRIASLQDDLAGLHDVVRRHARLIPSAPGQIVLLDHALIHGSLANTSETRRISVSCHMVPTDAVMLEPSVTEDTPAGYVDYRRTRPGRGRKAKPTTGRAPIDDLQLTPRKLDLACRAHRARRGAGPGDAVPPPGT